MPNSISCGFDHVWIDWMYNKQANNRVSSIIISQFVPRPHNKDQECCFLSEDGSMLKRNLKSALYWAMKAQRGSRGIAPLFLFTSAVYGGVCSAPRPGRLTPVKDPVPILIGGWVGPRAGPDVQGKSRQQDGIQSKRSHVLRDPHVPQCLRGLYRCHGSVSRPPPAVPHQRTANR